MKIHSTLTLVEIDRLIPYARNSRTHSPEQIAQIVASMKEFGFTNPVLVDEQGGIIAGHGRVMAARELGMDKVPCLTLEGLSEAQKRAYVIADNKLAENAGWDVQMLAQEMEELRLANYDTNLTGFDIGEIDDLFESFDDEEKDIVDGEIIDIPNTPITEEGDIWLLGKHRLMCGDSTNNEAMKKLMMNQLADLYITDPPYNVNYQGKTKERLQIINDNMPNNIFLEFLSNAFKCADLFIRMGGVFYVWHSESEGLNFRRAVIDAGWKFKQCLIWNKNNIALGRMDYQWKHEPCLYGWKDGPQHYFIDNRQQSTVFEDTRIKYKAMKKDELIKLVESLLYEKQETTVINEDKPIRNDIHPTMKPVNLIARIMRNSSKMGDIVLDSFGGSGTTLIVGEQIGRQSRIMELDPRYCDVIINRWQTLTGQQAVHAESSQRFSANG
jgi:site-specific DNA-methyltransferase (adenine-specific)